MSQIVIYCDLLEDLDLLRARNATMNRIEENEGNNENGLSRKAARFLQGE